ncbi:MAG: hypothetical protein LUD16_09890, partial [Lachnospiraceae bacterium]|nr:hypothetical protein [Lachnospiraceae bacterium]
WHHHITSGIFRKDKSEKTVIPVENAFTFPIFNVILRLLLSQKFSVDSVRYPNILNRLYQLSNRFSGTLQRFVIVHTCIGENNIVLVRA